MKYLSICSGIEAASVAREQLGWEAVGFSEIEPFPCAVLRHRFPHVPLHGDFTALIENPPSCDVLVGGTPCQAFSVAGSRRSLDDARGNLTLAYVMLADAIDRRNREEGKEPCITVWENVPGVFSTKDNAFGFLLRGLAGGLPGEDGPLEPPGGKWTHAGLVLGPQRAVAWRVLDAQYFGLAQRRQRVFVVASAREGFDPSQVLLEWEGVRRDSAPSREARKDPAAASGVRFAERRGDVRGHGAGHGSLSHWDGPQHPHLTLNQSFNTGAIGYSNQELFSQRGAGLVGDRDVVGAITARYGRNVGAPEVDAGLCIPTPEHDVVGALAASIANGTGGSVAVDAGFYIPLPETEVVGCLSDGAHNGGGLNGQDAYTGRILATIAPHVVDARIDEGVASEPHVAFGISSDAIDRSGEGDGSAAERAGLGIVENLAPTLRARVNNSVAYLAVGADEPPAYCYPDADQLGYAPRDEVPTPVEARVAPPPAYAVALRGREGGNTAELGGEIQPALRTGGGGSDKPHVLVAASQDPFVFDTTQVTHPANFSSPKPGDPSHPLAAAGHAPTLVQTIVAPALTASNDPSRSPQSTEVTQQVTAVLEASQPRMVVRRLTPRECERLQGFPDDWTLIPWKNKPAVDCPDGPRYKALGNSMAVPCMRWIGRRIDAHLKGAL